MMRRLLVLAGIEARKLLARRLTLFAFLLVLLVAFAGPWGGRVLETARGLGGERTSIDPYQNGWTALAGSVQSARLFQLVVLLVLAASTVAEETGLGTLKALCARPLRRSELLLSKLAVVWGYGVALHLCAVAAAALGAELTHGLYDVPVDPLFPERIKHAFGDMCVLLYQVTALGALPLLALCALGLLCSVLLEHSGHATGVAIGALFLCSAAAGLSDQLRPWVFTVHLGAAFESFQDIASRITGAETRLQAGLASALAVPLLWAGGLFGLSTWLLERRDIT